MTSAQKKLIASLQVIIDHAPKDSSVALVCKLAQAEIIQQADDLAALRQLGTDHG